jgi:hypothetical protein
MILTLGLFFYGQFMMIDHFWCQKSKNEKGKDETNQKRYAIVENIYGLALLFIFKLLGFYETLFWTAMFFHCILKINWTFNKIFKENGAFL